MRALAMGVVKRLNDETDVDFDLFVTATVWFAAHRTGTDTGRRSGCAD
ncbi:hypothetical protein [uncultured Bifidobacterium sp.]|nr:hypothetical protein [uncultured Bifidobacterium sp.]